MIETIPYWQNLINLLVGTKYLFFLAGVYMLLSSMYRKYRLTKHKPSRSKATQHFFYTTNEALGCLLIGIGIELIFTRFAS